MHERTSRALARLLFVVCCAVPTAITLTVIMVTRTSWYHQRSIAEIERVVATRTGLNVEIDAFSRQTPSRIQLHGVTLRHPETGLEVLHLYSLTWQSDDNGHVLHLKQPHLKADQLRAAWDLIHDRYLRQPAPDARPMTFLANDLTISGEGGELTFRDLDAAVSQHAQTTDVVVQGRLATEDRFADGFHAELRRDRTVRTPRTTWSLTTGKTALPCAVLMPSFPWLQTLGPDAAFAGSMSGETSLTSTKWSFNGTRFIDVQLDRLAEHWPHLIKGTADIHFHRFRVDPDGSQDIAGELIGRRGHLSGATIQALQDHLGWTASADLIKQRNVDFDRLSLWFDVRGDQMKLTGTCDTEAPYLKPGVVICRGEEALLTSGDNQPISVLRLAGLLGGEDTVQVPLNMRSKVLLRWLRPAAGGGPIRLSRMSQSPQTGTASVRQPR